MWDYKQTFLPLSWTLSPKQSTRFTFEISKLLSPLLIIWPLPHPSLHPFPFSIQGSDITIIIVLKYHAFVAKLAFTPKRIIDCKCVLNIYLQMRGFLILIFRFYQSICHSCFFRTPLIFAVNYIIFQVLHFYN